MSFVLLQIQSLKKERDTLVQMRQQEGPSDVHRVRVLQRENAQVCLTSASIKLIKDFFHLMKEHFSNINVDLPNVFIVAHLIFRL